MSVRFRFTNDKEESTIACEGYHIKAFELKREIVKRRRFGRTTTFDLKVTDSSLGKSYENEDLIPRNSSLTIARHPLPKGAKPIEWEKEDLPSAATSAEVAASGAEPVITGSTFAADERTEEDKLNDLTGNAAANDYDQRYWLHSARGRGRGHHYPPGSIPPRNYICKKCQRPGHFYHDCPVAIDFLNNRKTTGIPRSFLKPADKDTPGAKVNPQGLYMVVEAEKVAYEEKKKEKPMWEREEATLSKEVLNKGKISIPKDLQCLQCKELVRDAIMMPCCADGPVCDECARNALIESEGNTCPFCGDKDVSPDELIPHRKVRVDVDAFKKTQLQAVSQSAANAPVEARPTLPDFHAPNAKAENVFDQLVGNKPGASPPRPFTTMGSADPSPESSPTPETSPQFNDSFAPGTHPPGTRGDSPFRTPSPTNRRNSLSPPPPAAAASAAVPPPTRPALLPPPAAAAPPPPVTSAPPPRPVAGPPSRPLAPGMPLPDVSLPPPGLPPPGYPPPTGPPPGPAQAPPPSYRLPEQVPTHRPPAPYAVPPPAGIPPPSRPPPGYGAPPPAHAPPPRDHHRHPAVDKDGYVEDPLEAFNRAMAAKDSLARNKRINEDLRERRPISPPPPHHRRPPPPPMHYGSPPRHRGYRGDYYRDMSPPPPRGYRTRYPPPPPSPPDERRPKGPKTPPHPHPSGSSSPPPPSAQSEGGGKPGTPPPPGEGGASSPSKTAEKTNAEEKNDDQQRSRSRSTEADKAKRSSKSPAPARKHSGSPPPLDDRPRRDYSPDRRYSRSPPRRSYSPPPPRHDGYHRDYDTRYYDDRGYHDSRRGRGGYGYYDDRGRGRGRGYYRGRGYPDTRGRGRGGYYNPRGHPDNRRYYDDRGPPRPYDPRRERVAPPPPPDEEFQRRRADSGDRPRDHDGRRDRDERPRSRTPPRDGAERARSKDNAPSRERDQSRERTPSLSPEPDKSEGAKPKPQGDDPAQRESRDKERREKSRDPDKGPSEERSKRESQDRHSRREGSADRNRKDSPGRHDKDRREERRSYSPRGDRRGPPQPQYTQHHSSRHYEDRRGPPPDHRLESNRRGGHYPRSPDRDERYQRHKHYQQQRQRSPEPSSDGRRDHRREQSDRYYRDDNHRSPDRDRRSPDRDRRSPDRDRRSPDRRSPDRRYSREDSRDDHHNDADRRRASRSRSPSPMVTGPTSTKDKKVKKGKKTKKRKHHETTGSDSEHQQSSEKKKKSKKTKKVHHQKKHKEESGDAQAEPKDDEAPSEKAEANQQSPPKKADLYAGLSPPIESAERNAEDLVSREAQQLEAVVQIAVQASRPEQPPEEEMDDTLDMHAGDQSFGDDHLASSGGQPNSAPAVAAPIQTQQPLPELSKWEKESGDELGDDSDTEEKVNGDDSDLRSLLKTKSTLSTSTSQKQTVSLSHKSIDVDALNNLSAKEVSKKGDEESGDGSASSDHESEKRSKKKSKKKDKKKEKKAKSEKKLKKKYMEAIEEMMKDGKLKDIVNKRFSRSSSRSPPPHPRGSRGGGRSRSRSGSREYQRRKVDYDDGRERTRGRSPAGRRQSRSPDETRRRITNKGSRSRSRSPPGQLASSRLMDMSDSSRKSVKDRLGPRLGGSSSSGSKKGFDQDHWRGGASAPDARKKLGRDERKQQSRREDFSPTPPKRKRGDEKHSESVSSRR